QSLAADPNRPTFTFPATTTQCGMFEADFGFTTQDMGQGVHQNYAPVSLRYGVTPRLDLRWGAVNHIWQTGNPTLQGAGDEYLGARYMFIAQSHRVPALGVFYQFKIPAANPAKGLGSGFADNLLTLLASKDLGKYHVDFNLDGTLAGAAHSTSPAVQGDLALTRALGKTTSVVLESFGGSQPATPNRLGIALLGATWSVRPWLVLDTAYDKTYTGTPGQPRQQFLIGGTCTLRPPWRKPPPAK
ncbi:MAG: hypothetical protein ABSA94_16240, partial [Acidobacteriaceae bacterium]